MRARPAIPGLAFALAALLAAAPLAQAQTAAGGVGGPSPTHNPGADTRGGAAVTAPSGESPRARSARCNRVARQRRLTGSARQEFRLSCMATAAPATHAGTQHVLPRRTPAKNDLGAATPGSPH